MKFIIESMIKIETVLDILKKDGLFREMLTKDITNYNYSEVVFDSTVTTVEK